MFNNKMQMGGSLNTGGSPSGISSGSGMGGGSIGPSKPMNQNVAKPPSMGGLGNSMQVPPGGNASMGGQTNVPIGPPMGNGMGFPENVPQQGGMWPGSNNGGFLGLPQTIAPSFDFSQMQQQPQLQFPQIYGESGGWNPPNSLNNGMQFGGPSPYGMQDDSSPFLGNYGGNQQMSTIGPNQPNPGRFGKL